MSKDNFKGKEKLATAPDGGLTPGKTGRLTVDRKMHLTLSTADSYRLDFYHIRSPWRLQGLSDPVKL
jgi:hypothetical protein